jgi:ABC-type sugar transport system ATPase subunit
LKWGKLIQENTESKVILNKDNLFIVRKLADPKTKLTSVDVHSKGKGKLIQSFNLKL